MGTVEGFGSNYFLLDEAKMLVMLSVHGSTLGSALCDRLSLVHSFGYHGYMF